MNRFDLVGLTLAEVALVLLFFVIVVFVPRTQSNTQPGVSKEAFEALERENDELRADAAKLREELLKYRPNLKSQVTPSCVEVKKATGWLFNVTILGPDRYEVEGQSLTLGALMQKYGSAISQGKQDQCVHRIRVYAGNVSLPAYDEALRKLEDVFYTLRVEVQP